MSTPPSTSPTSTPPRFTNRLARETSPYLLQHAHNPVDWYAWGPEAFQAAREQDKPIFLSVGYSTCYWCHVMERQCFENEAIAELMNRHFINIKVDREERPDVDQLYMTAVQVLTRSGGWPMSVFLTPDGRPFFGGTYFPPEDMHGRPGFPRLLEGLADAYTNRRSAIDDTTAQLLGVLHQLATPRPPESDLTFDAARLAEYVTRSVADYEPVHGGFGKAPKFPRQTLLKLLLAYIDGAARRDPRLARRVREMLTHTLSAMDRGGIHDHLGGGFHRYSTDSQWLVPHFEIMLYDQAMLADVYATAARVLGEARFAEVARGICDFVLREMTSPEGGFYTGFDAEVDHYEGQNYLWTRAEIDQLLGPSDAALFNCVYGVDQGPNFADPHQSRGAPPDRNILFLDRPYHQAAHEHGVSVEDLLSRLAAARATLKAVRDRRKQPLLDTKILTSWNALMAAALATCGRELGEPRYTQAAVRNCRYLLASHRKPDGGLYRTSRDGQPRYDAFLDDYAALAFACLLTGDPDLERDAQTLTDQMLARFGSNACHTSESQDHGPHDHPKTGGCGNCKSGGLFFTDAASDELILRQKVASDSPLPSGNAQAALVLIAQGNPDRAKAIFTEFAQALDDNVESMSALAEALTRYTRHVGDIEVKAVPLAQQGHRTPEDLARRVVGVEARFTSETELQLRLSIADGFHIHAADTATSGYIATHLEFEGADVHYPAPVTVRLPFAPEDLEVYSGQIVLTASFAIPPTQVLRGTLTYQPCDDTSCLPVVTRPIEIHP